MCRELYSTTNEPVLVAVASDGAGSAPRAEVGAQLACSSFLTSVENFLDRGGIIRELTKDFAEEWLVAFQSEITALADTEDLKPRAFACTLLAAIVAQDCAAFFQVGDGAIIVSTAHEPDDYCWVFWPQKGEYENMTFFATDVMIEDCEFDVVEGEIAEAAIFTDGIQRLALHIESQTVHQPFFRPMFKPLRERSDEQVAELSALLATYLDSPQINDRVDDDKTLILASRLRTDPPNTKAIADVSDGAPPSD